MCQISEKNINKTLEGWGKGGWAIVMRDKSDERSKSKSC